MQKNGFFSGWSEKANSIYFRAVFKRSQTFSIFSIFHVKKKYNKYFVFQNKIFISIFHLGKIEFYRTLLFILLDST